MPFLKKLKKRERILLYLVFALIASSLIYNFILEPIVKRYCLVNQEINKSQAKLKKYRYMLSQKEKIRAQFERISESVKTEYSEEEQMALILSEIEDLSRRSSVRITQIKPQTTKDYGTYKELSAEIKAEAKIEDISRFIYNLQDSPQLLRTKKLLLNTKSADQDTLEAVILVVKIFLP